MKPAEARFANPGVQSAIRRVIEGTEPPIQDITHLTDEENERVMRAAGRELGLSFTKKRESRAIARLVGTQLDIMLLESEIATTTE